MIEFTVDVDSVSSAVVDADVTVNISNVVVVAAVGSSIDKIEVVAVTVLGAEVESALIFLLKRNIKLNLKNMKINQLF